MITSVATVCSSKDIANLQNHTTCNTHCMYITSTSSNQTNLRIPEELLALLTLHIAGGKQMLAEYLEEQKRCFLLYAGLNLRNP